MTTIRVHRRKRFTTIDREAANDERLSFRARGILLWLLDKPDDWRCNSDDIAAAGLEGRDAVRAALRELQALDYIVRRREQNDVGQWVTMTDVFETPQTEALDADDGIPVVGQPGVGAPGVGEPGPIPKTETEDCERRETSSLAVRQRDEVWDALVTECGDAVTGPEKSRRGKVVKELKAVGATAADIHARCAEYRRRWTVELTDTALMSHWSKMAHVKAAPVRLSTGGRALQSYIERHA